MAGKKAGRKRERTCAVSLDRIRVRDRTETGKAERQKDRKTERQKDRKTGRRLTAGFDAS